jgi:hypothetical protein
MSESRWFNSRLPQTLVISQFLLYFDAAFAVLGALGVTFDIGFELGGLVRLLSLASLAAFVYGAWGIANERKRGYQVAVAASFAPLVIRIVAVIQAGVSLSSNLRYVLLGGGVLNALFEYALIGLLLHTQSREHQRIWFS